MIPIVDYGYGGRNLITDYITPANPDVYEIARRLDSVGDKFVENVARYIRDEFRYPLDAFGNPSCGGQVKRYPKYLIYLFGCRYVDTRYYVWAFPNETLRSKLGFCAETANLGVSILLNRVPACVVLGDVMRRGDKPKEDYLLGRHAWVETPYKGETLVLETTIHEEINNLTTAQSVYDRDSDWAKQGHIYYIPRGRYNDKTFWGDADIVSMMGLSAVRVMEKRLVLASVITEASEAKAKTLAREFKEEEKLKTRIIRQAWGGK